MKRGVIYTCITGSYDDLIHHAYTDPRWDYVCFTDDPSLIAQGHALWQLKLIVFDRLDKVRINRWHKLHPHILFPDCQKSIYVDGNVNILKKDFFDDIERAITNNYKIALSLHHVRDCIYEELLACIEGGKDCVDLMKKQIEFIKKDNFPKKQGLFDNSIIYREHHDREIISIMDHWWWFIENFSRRDQLSLNYILWKHHFKANKLTDIPYRLTNKVKYSYQDSHFTKEELLNKKNKLEDIVRKCEADFLSQQNAFEDAIRQKDQVIHLLQQEIHRLGQELVRLIGVYEAVVQQKDGEINRLVQENNQYERNLKNQQDLNEDILQKLAWHERRLASLLYSWSWRLTQPLRQLHDLIQKRPLKPKLP